MELIRIETDESVAIVTLNRPPAHALDPALAEAGLATLDALRASRPAAVVVTGSGAFFSGGADLRVVPSLGPDEQAKMARDVNELFIGWYGLPRPVVCAVNGHAVAGGLVLALCGDYRVAATSGKFGLTEVKVGIPYPPAALAVVQAEVTAPVARRLVLRGELFDSASMLAFGVFDEVVADNEVLPRAIAVARELAELPSSAYEIIKRALRRETLRRSEDRRSQESVSGWATDEARAASTAVLEGPRP